MQYNTPEQDRNVENHAYCCGAALKWKQIKYTHYI